MTDEPGISKRHTSTGQNAKKKENIRVFVQRKRLPYVTQTKPNAIEQLTSIIEKHLNGNKKIARNNKNIIVVNYKPVYMNNRQQKSTEPKPLGTLRASKDNISAATQNNQTTKMTPIANRSRLLNTTPFSLDVPDVEDPLVFIEMMYQQLFTDDGQLRSGAQPTKLADCVKEIVTQSRSNSIVHKDSLTPARIHHDKRVLTPFDPSMSSKRTSLSSPCVLANTLNKGDAEKEVDDDDDFYALLQATRTPNASRRSSNQSSLGNAEVHLQQLHAFVNSYCHNGQRRSKNQSRNDRSSADDTDNEDFDGFSDFNSYRRTMRTSLPASIDEDITHTDSKLLSSSGYQSLQSTKRMSHKMPVEIDPHYCSHCIRTPTVTMTPPTKSLSLMQPMRDMVTNFFHFVIVSKNILLLPLCIFLLRQRSITFQ
ncbi:unnamed protein product [Rotaria magnacalcarata]|uniref:Uncharacterized protein n=8 Tax=Rotaria magnacalcarata TaxID=392030 RepID=A0A816LNR5_9BILA|nr:unnamed protein product [Rotaria magnacalcarata]CAF4161665.1 unnamed protein product [Rotaria magnacalcarata]